MISTNKAGCRKWPRPVDLSRRRTGGLLESLILLAGGAVIAGAIFYTANHVLGERTRWAELAHQAGQRKREALDSLMKSRLKDALLGMTDRAAEVELLAQYTDPQTGRTKSRIRFKEIMSDGSMIGEPVEATIDGSRLLIDAQVVKFEDQLVEEMDPLRGSSLVRFRGLLGESDPQGKPAVRIESPARRPGAYRTRPFPVDLLPTATQEDRDEWEATERNLWDNFWDYASDPAKMKEVGVRQMQGEMPVISFRQSDVGKFYTLRLGASGGLVLEKPGAEARQNAFDAFFTQQERHRQAQSGPAPVIDDEDLRRTAPH